MEQTVASKTVRRSLMAARLAALPPIATGLPERPLTIDEKHLTANGLPCIMITPSSPTHEFDYEIHYFSPTADSSSAGRCRGFLSSIRQVVWPSSHIALPVSPKPAATTTSITNASFGYNGEQRSCWSASKRFRMILALAAVLFFALHLVALPRMDNGVYEVFSTHHHGSQMMDDAVASWETVKEWNPSPHNVVAGSDSVPRNAAAV